MYMYIQTDAVLLICSFFQRAGLQDILCKGCRIRITSDQQGYHLYGRCACNHSLNLTMPLVAVILGAVHYETYPGMAFETTFTLGVDNLD